MDTPIHTNCCKCTTYIMTQGYEPFWCCTRRDTASIISSKATHEEVQEAIRKGSHTGCGAYLVAYRQANMHRTRQAVSGYEVNKKRQHYSPDILAKRVKPNHANHYQESDAIDIPK